MGAWLRRRADRLRPSEAASLKLLVDVLLICAAAAWAWVVCYGQKADPGQPWPYLLVVLAARVPLNHYLGVSRTSWEHFSRADALRLALSAALGAPLIALLLFILPPPFTLGGLTRPWILLVTEPVFNAFLLAAGRATARLTRAAGAGSRGEPILILGAGSAGLTLAFQTQEAPHGIDAIGFLDDDPAKQGKFIRGLPVFGPIAKLPEIAAKRGIRRVVVAIPSAGPQRTREILDLCLRSKLQVQTVPSLSEMLDGRADVTAVREVRMEDLLPRPVVMLENGVVTEYLRGKTVLVTGGGGSIGRELCRQVLLAGASRIIVLGRGENSVFEGCQELEDLDGTCEVIPAICDVQDRVALARVFDRFGPQVVYHAAAHKHVPLMEMYPAEAIKNNVLGTLNVVELAAQAKVERLVLISTDKAVDPVNVMGASKRLAELIVKAYAETTGVRMVSVRFGNVLGSRGSVVPTMQRQVSRRRPVTVTDPRMVRYFMTIPEAVSLVLHAAGRGAAGDVFVLNMGHPVRIIDLARDLIRLSGLEPDVDIPIRVIGRRPGEKTSENLMTAWERGSVANGEHYSVVPPEPVELNALRWHINRLRDAALRDDRLAIIRILQEVIPAYRPADAELPVRRVTDEAAHAAHGE